MFAFIATNLKGLKQSHTGHGDAPLQSHRSVD